MKLSEKIALQRKRKGWSQEELAFRLEVSRQAVSKWEIGNSVPDIDNVLKMSQLFGCSTDYLLKENDGEESIEEPVTQSAELTVRTVSDEEGESYLRLVKSLSKKLGLGVALCVFSPVLLFVVLGISEFGIWTEGIWTGIGLGCLLAIVAVGVLFLVRCGIALSKYDYLEKEVIAVSSELKEKAKGQREAENKKFAWAIAVGVVLCVLSAVPLIVFGSMADENNPHDQALVLFAVGGLLLLVSVAVFLFVTFGVVHGSYSKILQEEEYSVAKKREEQKTKLFSEMYWGVTVALYLGLSFILEDAWDKTWIIWPIAGVVYGVVRAIVWAVIKNKKK